MATPRADRLLGRIEGLTAQLDDEPGVAVSVIRGADVIARRQVGLASLPHRVPIGPHTRFHIVSVSKTFMAAAVLVLVARGALRLDDDVRRHLPELPAEVSPGGASIDGVFPLPIRLQTGVVSGPQHPRALRVGPIQGNRADRSGAAAAGSPKPIGGGRQGRRQPVTSRVDHAAEPVEF